MSHARTTKNKDVGARHWLRDKALYLRRYRGETIQQSIREIGDELSNRVWEAIRSRMCHPWPRLVHVVIEWDMTEERVTKPRTGRR